MRAPLHDEMMVCQMRLGVICDAPVEPPAGIERVEESVKGTILAFPKKGPPFEFHVRARRTCSNFHLEMRRV